MSQENVEVVRSMYDAFRRDDRDATMSYFDTQVVLDASHRVDGRVGQGHEELAAITAEWIGTWEDWREEIEEFRDLKDQVLVISTQSGRGKGSGVEWENRFAMLFEVQNGQITRWSVYDRLDKALEAAGLRE